MERRAALELLALDPDEPVAHDKLRRAYLRRLRIFPPESDPDGFRRLREAFELIEPIARAHDAAMLAAPARYRTAPRPVQLPTREVEDEAPASDASAPARIRPDADADTDADADADADADEAFESETTPIPWGGPPPAPEAAPIATRRPEAEAAPSPADAEAPEPETAPIPRPIRLLEVPPMAAPLRVSVDVEPSLREVTSEILARFERGELDPALDLANRWQHSAADDHRAVSSLDAARWALTRELVEIAPVLTIGIRRAIARGIANDDLASAGPAVEAFGAIDPRRAADLDRHTSRRAENLHKAIWRPLHARQAHVDPILSPPPPKRRGTPLWLVAVLLLSALLRACASCPDHSTRDRYEPIQIPQGTRWPDLDRDAPRFAPNPPRLAPDPPRFDRDPPRLDRELPRLEPEPAPPAMPGDPPPRTPP